MIHVCSGEIAVELKNGDFMVLPANGHKVWGKRRDRAGSINDVRLVVVVDVFILLYETELEQLMMLAVVEEIFILHHKTWTNQRYQVSRGGKYIYLSRCEIQQLRCTFQFSY